MDWLTVSICLPEMHNYYYHIAGNDYSSGPYNVTVLPGTTSTFFVVPILRDNLVEGNEEFTLTINTILLPSDVTVGHPAEALVTIVDGIGKEIL